MFNPRLHRASAWVGVFALILQLMLPTAHAQAWAQRNGTPMLALFCGAVSPALLDEFRGNALPEMLGELAGTDANAAQNLLDCKFCGSLHGNPPAGAPPGLHVPIAPAASPIAAAAILHAPDVELVRLPPLRAPPSLS